MAFDTIDHKIRLNKLCMYGIRGITHNWFKNYLSERYPYVSINNCSSSLQKIKCGKPQGSILGPIISLRYINDLPNACNILRFLLYADDTNILYKNLDTRSITDTMNKEIPKVTEWFNSNKLRINTNKTVAMLFHTRQRTVAINECLIKINDDTIPFSTHTTFLVVNIDNNLTWKPYISHIVTKISKGVGILLHLSKELPKNILTLIYKTLILPYFKYCCITLSITYHTYIDKLLNIKKAMRIITHSPTCSHSSPLFKQLQFLYIYQIIKLQATFFMSDLLNNIFPNTFEHKFIPTYNHHSYKTRNNLSLRTLFFFFY